MKNTLLLFLLISSLQSIAQNANWGTGLPVTVNISGSSLNLSVFDPISNQTRTTSLSVGSNPIYSNSDGVVVAFGSNGDMVFATYDIELQTWKTSSYQISSSNSTGTILTSDGVVVGYGNLGDMDYATYDVELQTWKTSSSQISSNNSAGTILTSDGVVVGYGNLGDMDYATYDVELQTWKTSSSQISSSNSTGTILTSDGVVVGYGNLGDMDYATYDVELHTWKTSSSQISSNNSAGTILTSDGVVVGYGTFGDMDYATYDLVLRTWKTGSLQISSSNSTGTILTSDGVVAGYGTLDDLDYAIYDFNLNSWKTGYKFGSSGNFSISSGTINYSGTSSGIIGYNPNTQHWGSYNTTTNCNFLPVVFSSSSWVFMRCMSIGAGIYTYSSGDGHQISRKQGWKKYNNDNSYNANLNVSNGINNSTCNTTINIATGIEEYNSLGFDIFPNPATDRIFIDCAERKEFKLQVYNIIGECTLQHDLTNGKNMIDISSLTSGIYVIRLTETEGTYQQKLTKN